MGVVFPGDWSKEPNRFSGFPTICGAVCDVGDSLSSLPPSCQARFYGPQVRRSLVYCSRYLQSSNTYPLGVAPTLEDVPLSGSCYLKGDCTDVVLAVSGPLSRSELFPPTPRASGAHEFGTVWLDSRLSFVAWRASPALKREKPNHIAVLVDLSHL